MWHQSQNGTLGMGTDGRQGRVAERACPVGRGRDGDREGDASAGGGVARARAPGKAEGSTQDAADNEWEAASRCGRMERTAGREGGTGCRGWEG